jgi:hypothetical protein
MAVKVAAFQNRRDLHRFRNFLKCRSTLQIWKFGQTTVAVEILIMLSATVAAMDLAVQDLGNAALRFGSIDTNA